MKKFILALAILTVSLPVMATETPKKEDFKAFTEACVKYSKEMTKATYEVAEKEYRAIKEKFGKDAIKIMASFYNPCARCETQLSACFEGCLNMNPGCFGMSCWNCCYFLYTACVVGCQGGD